MKLCIDCKHFKRDWITYIVGRNDEFGKCVRPEGISLVDGKSRVKTKYADLERSYEHDCYCGEEAKYFEEKK